MDGLRVSAAETKGSRPPQPGDLTAESARVPELDALRGCAALGVLALHTMYSWFFWAWSCVDLFFVLSGFLITGILLRNGGRPQLLVPFYVRRALRIWPVYYLTFAIVVVLWIATGWLKQGELLALPDGHWLGLVFLQYTNYYLSPAPGVEYVWYFAHSWSLAVEEQFYLLWPLLFLFLRPRLSWVAAACVALVAAAVAARGQGEHFHLLLTRVDGLLFGVLLAYLAADRSSILYRAPAWWFAFLGGAGVALLLPYLASHGQQNLFGVAPNRAIEVAAFCLVFACMVAVAVRWSGARALAPLRWKPLIHAGRLSFAIYMYQVPISYVLLECTAAGLMNRTGAKLLTWILTLAAAELSHRLIERRALALKARFPYGGSGRDAVHVGAQPTPLA